MKILIVQTAFIGDVILATSMAETIASLRPGSQIDFLVRNGNEGLLKNNPLISNVIVWNKKKKLKSLFSSLALIRREKYDAVVNIQRFMNSGILTAFSGSKKRIGFSSNPASAMFTHKIQHKIPHITPHGGYLHEVQRNAQLLKAIIPELDIQKTQAPKLYFNREIETKILELTSGLESYIVLAPTSVWFTKQWSAQRWSELAKALSAKHKLFFIGAPADREAIENIIDASPNCENLAGKLSLLESAYLMRDAARVFVNDSAPLHLASSVNAKTTAIFCSTIPEFGYTPLSDDSVVITRHPRLECQPCGLHGKKQCPLGHFKCSLEIIADEVLKTVATSSKIIYHIAREQDFEEAKKRGFYASDSLASEGFIHMAFKEQVQDTGKRYYQGVDSLILLSIDATKLEDLRIENGFPHLYSALPIEAVTEHKNFRA